MKRGAIVAALAAIALILLLFRNGDDPSPGPPDPDPDSSIPAVAPGPAPERAGGEPTPSEEVADDSRATASAWDLRSISVGAGPLLAASRERVTDELTFIEHALVDVESGTEPLVWLRHPTEVRVTGRFDASRILVNAGRRRREFHVVDLVAATHAPFLPGRKFKLLTVEKGEAYVLDHDSGLLLAVDPARPDLPRTLFPERVEKVLSESAEHFFVRTRGPPGMLWRVARRNGRTARVAPFRKWWSLWGVDFHASPDGSRLAVATTRGLGDVERAGADTGPSIMILDVESGDLRVVAKDIPIGVSLISSSMPRLALVWLDGHRLRFSETEMSDDPDGPFEGRFRWVDMDVRTGERLAVRRYGKLGLSHETPPRDIGGFDGGEYSYSKWSTNRFRREKNRVFFVGDDEPAAEIVGKHTRVVRSPDGETAALLAAPDAALTILDGRAHAVWTVPGEGWRAFSFVPAAR